MNGVAIKIRLDASNRSSYVLPFASPTGSVVPDLKRFFF
jgi:hypothetical protein